MWVSASTAVRILLSNSVMAWRCSNRFLNIWVNVQLASTLLVDTEEAIRFGNWMGGTLHLYELFEDPEIFLAKERITMMKGMEDFHIA
jgi:hypothetical protein